MDHKAASGKKRPVFSFGRDRLSSFTFWPKKASSGSRHRGRSSIEVGATIGLLDATCLGSLGHGAQKTIGPRI